MSQEAIRVLLVEDDEDDYVLTRRLLTHGTRHRYALDWASSYEAGMQAIQKQSYDVCLLDYQLGPRTGLEFLGESRELLGYATPTILFTGLDSVEIDEEVLHYGAADYLVKGQVSTALLERTIRYARERARTNAALHHSEQVLRATLDALTAHIAILDRDGQIIATNASWDGFAAQNGYQGPGRGLGCNYLDICRQAIADGIDQAQTVHDALRDVLAGVRRDFTLEYPCHSPREERWFSLRLLTLETGPVVGAVVAHENVTSRIKAEAETARSTRRFRALIENSTDLLMLVDAHGRSTFASSSVSRALGYTSEEFTGIPLEQLIHRDDAAYAGQLFQEVRGQSRKIAAAELRMLHRAGHWVWMECVLHNLLADPDVRAVLINSRDITERKNAAIALLESESRYRDLFESAHDIVYTLDLDGMIQTLNHAAERVLGYSRTEPGSLEFRSLVAPEYYELMTRMRDEKLAGRPSTMYEIEMISRSGQRLVVETNTTLIFRNGQPTGILGIGRDVTARRQVERFEKGRRAVLEQVAQNCVLPQILEQVAGLVEQRYPGCGCVIRLVEDTKLRLIASSGQTPEWYRQEVHTVALDANTSPCGAAAHRREAVYSADLAAEVSWSHWRLVTLAAGFHACWSLPVLSTGGRILGVLTVYRTVTGLPDPGDEVLERAAQLAAISVEHRQLSDELAYQAQHDALTGLPNRLLFQDRLQQAIARAHRTGQRVGLLYLDLDNFKAINDSLGHPAGDKLLQEVAARLRKQLREVDTLARLGGDEFTVTITDLAGVEEAKLVAERVLDVFRSPFQIDGRELFLTTSVGLSLYPRDGQDADILLQQADAAMYNAKQRGKNSFHSYSAKKTDKSKNQLQLRTDLHRAVERNELELVYQPQVDLSSGLLAGFEVLLRWQHPTLGGIPPSTFIPLAEESGLIGSIGNWVLEEACRQGQLWQQSGSLPVRLGVNVSALQFARTGWPKGVGEILADSGFPPCFLDLELTESLVMHDVNESVRNMNKLRQMGVGISIDDFGTGYSSLAYLQRLPINRLKIDVSFIREIKPRTKEAPLVQAIIALAHSLQIRVVAEGVETQHQLALLQRLNCDEAQGYLFARPLNAVSAEQWLRGATQCPVLFTHSGEKSSSSDTIAGLPGCEDEA